MSTEYSKESRIVEFTEHLLKILGYLIGPIIGLFAFLGKRMHTRLDSLENDNKKQEVQIAVLESQYRDIKEDIHKIDEKLDRIITLIPKRRRDG